MFSSFQKEHQEAPKKREELYLNSSVCRALPEEVWGTLPEDLYLKSSTWGVPPEELCLLSSTWGTLPEELYPRSSTSRVLPEELCLKPLGLNWIHINHVSLQDEHQHLGFAGDSSRRNRDAAERLVFSAQSLRLRALQWKSPGSPAVLVALGLILPRSGVQSASIGLLSHGAWMARMEPTPQS